MSSAETERLRALRNLGVLDTLPEEGFDRLTGLAAALFDAPIALVSLIDQDRQWFKSRCGLDVAETPRAWAFCNHAIAQGPHATMIVQDAALDARFADNPLVTGDPHVRFYAGATLTNAAGHNYGTLCVIDNTARSAPSQGDIERLSILARMVVDELELRQAKRALAEQKRLLELAELMSGVGHWRYDVVDGHVTWSDEVYRIHGLDPAVFDPNYEQALACYHPDDRDTVSSYVARAIGHGEDYAFQLRLLRGDGELRHVTCKAACHFDPQGRTATVFGVFQDVTDQVRTLTAVAQSEARYRRLADNASDIVTEAGLDGRFTYVSPAAKAITGFDEHDLIGRQALDLVHPDDQARVETEIGAALNSPGGKRIEHRHIAKDGRVVWVESRPMLARDPLTGRAVAVTDVLRDITERKELESQLRQARVEAESAAAVKSEFLANMSHELRTPLTSILGFSKLLSGQGGLDDEGRRYLQRVSDASQALLTTVNDILDFSKLEAGQVEIAPHPIDPSALAVSAVELLSPQAAAKGLSLTVDCAGLPAEVMADDTRIRQILLNLISNAVKFTASGGVTLQARYDGATEQLRFEVIDTGPGVPEDRLDRLFKRFSQVDASTTRSHGGTGLGLAICKGLAEAMGGSVGASSLVGTGSRFWVQTPCPAVAPAAARANMAALCASADLQGLRALIVDDNAVNRELVRIILTPFGVNLTEAGGGRAAVDLAACEAFDVILMDVRMPDLDGPTAARMIRVGSGPNAGVPIIAFTAEASDRELPAAWQGIFSDQLPKPIIAAELLAVVDACRSGAAQPMANGGNQSGDRLNCPVEVRGWR